MHKNYLDENDKSTYCRLCLSCIKFLSFPYPGVCFSKNPETL